ncbi:unnamed protein product [Amoebophrya sp. A25]|nr:unnamed protein product [Amoebophrya sp. A25]|eukprot:GSA25T00011305001.1
MDEFPVSRPSSYTTAPRVCLIRRDLPLGATVDLLVSLVKDEVIKRRRQLALADMRGHLDALELFHTFPRLDVGSEVETLVLRKNMPNVGEDILTTQTLRDGDRHIHSHIHEGHQHHSLSHRDGSNQQGKQELSLREPEEELQQADERVEENNDPSQLGDEDEEMGAHSPAARRFATLADLSRVSSTGGIKLLSVEGTLFEARRRTPRVP